MGLHSDTQLEIQEVFTASHLIILTPDDILALGLSV